MVSYKATTKLGIWSVRLIMTSLLFFALFFVLVATGQRGGDTFFSNPLLTIPMLVAVILAVSSFFTGISSVLGHRERAVLVYLSTLLGFFVLLFAIAELTFQH